MGWSQPTLADWHQPPASGGSQTLFLRDHGGVADAQTLSDGAIASGLKALTSATGLFVAGDVGKTVIVAAAGAAGDDLRTTIAAYVSATEVTLTAAAGGTVTGATFSWGTDNKAEIDTLLAALAPTLIGGRWVGGGILDLGDGSILTSGGHSQPRNVQIVGQGEQATNIIHTGNNTCFLHDPGTAGIADYQRPGMADFSLWGNNGAGAEGVQLRGKLAGNFFERVMIGNYGGFSGTTPLGHGLTLHNFNAGDFAEGITLGDLTLRYNAINVEIRRTGGNASFAYQKWLNFAIHVPANGIGILIGDDTASTATCQVYNGVFVGNIWLEGDGAIAVKIGQFGEVDPNTIWQVRGEVIGSHPTAKALVVNAGGQFQPRGIHDFAVGPAATQPPMDVGSATLFRPPTRVDETLAAQGFVRETFSRIAIDGSTALTVGTDFGTLCQFRRGDVVKGITVGVATNGTGTTLVKLGICDTAGTLLATTADNSANFNAGTAGRLQDTDLTTPWTCPYDGAFYLVVVAVTGTGPTLIRAANLAAAVSTARSGKSLLAVQSAGGKTDLASFTPVGSGVVYWFATY